MPIIHRTVHIDESTTKAWDVLTGTAPYGDCASGVGKASAETPHGATPVDAQPSERVPPSWCIAKRVVAWDEGGNCTFDAYEAGLPARIESLHFEIDTRNEKTAVTLTAIYDIKRDSLSALRWLSVQRSLSQRLADNLQRLKRVVEASQPEATAELMAA